MEDDKFLYALGALINAFGGGGDRGNAFPQSDVDDFANGARYIPGEVTTARQRGETVIFNSQAHEWTMPDGKIVK